MRSTPQTTHDSGTEEALDRDPRFRFPTLSRAALRLAWVRGVGTRADDRFRDLRFRGSIPASRSRTSCSAIGATAALQRGAVSASIRASGGKTPPRDPGHVGGVTVQMPGT